MTTKLGLFGLPTTASGPRNYILNFEEAFGVEESTYTNPSGWHLSFTESLNFAESRTRGVVRAVVESLSYAESRMRSLSRSRTESFDTEDDLSRTFGKNVSEGFSVTALAVEETEQGFGEQFSVEDVLTKHLQVGFTEFFFVLEAADYPRFFHEIFAVSDTPSVSLDAIRVFAEDYEVNDALEKSLHKTFEQDLEYSDSMSRSFSKNITEAFLVTDTLLRGTNGVVFDFYIRSDSMEASDFDIVSDSPPVGYTPFQIFYPGDYQFTEAMGGVRVRGAQNGGQAGILGLTHNVDVPDVTDRGQATVTALEAAGTGEHTVTFVKTFTAPPEVNLVWISGPSAAVAEIISVTETQFVFILRDVSSPSTKVEGTTTWAALGR